ncbi:hypothetical protein TNCV_1263671 [Trichonephila clavipes]|nr:hypothetical protein TNCV_1263671 [Trichonephila clavipes]
MDRLSEMSEQRRIIEEKKQEILRKIAEKKRKKEDVEGTTSNIVTSSNTSFPVKIPRLSTTNQFKNDGSFLDQFRKMQESNVAKPDIKSDSSSTKSGIVMKIQAPERIKMKREVAFSGSLVRLQLKNGMKSTLLKSEGKQTYLSFHLSIHVTQFTHEPYDAEAR